MININLNPPVINNIKYEKNSELIHSYLRVNHSLLKIKKNCRFTNGEYASLRVLDTSIDYQHGVKHEGMDNRFFLKKYIVKFYILIVYKLYVFYLRRLGNTPIANVILQLTNPNLV